MWRCLIIEDDHENGQYLMKGLTEMGHVARVCLDGPTGVQAALQSEWDIIILDRMLPDDVDGLALLASLRAMGQKTPVLVLSAFARVEDRIRGLRAGADDYLAKPFSFLELIARVEILIRGRQNIGTPRELRVADLTAIPATRRVQRRAVPIHLQPREFRLLAYLMSNAEQLVTRTMLLEAVWDYRFDPQTNVIDVQMSRLRRKIDAGTGIPLIHTERGAGYLMSAEAPPQTGKAPPAREPFSAGFAS